MKHLIATVKAADDETGSFGSFEAIASMDTVDRDGEVVAKGAFDPLPTSIPIHVDHQMNSEGLVGSGRPFYTSAGVLKVAGTFAGTPRAQIIRQLVVEGHLSSMSVGFMGMTRRDVGGVPTITNAELLEVSFVTVPSNRDARVLVSRGYGNAAGAHRVVTHAKTQVARVLADLALADLDDIDRQHPLSATEMVAKSQRVVADAEALLRRLKGTR